MSSVKSLAVLWISKKPFSNCRLEARGHVGNLAIRSNERTNAAIRYSNQRPIVFNRAKNRVCEMLSHHRRRSQVTVVRDIDQDIGSFLGEYARDRRMRCLDTNKNPGAQVAEGHQRVPTAGRKFADDSTYRTRAR